MNTGDGFMLTLGALVGAAAIALMSCIWISNFKMEAVEAGSAEWIVDARGRVEFRWINLKEKGE